MNRQIRRVGVFLLIVFAVLIANVAWVQLVHSDAITAEPANQTRRLAAEYRVQRGPIVSSDGVTLAESVRTNDPVLRFERRYPQGPTAAAVTGFKSPQFGSSLAERSFNDVLQGADTPLTTDSIVDRLARRVNGNTVVLTIDMRVQRAAVEALGDQVGAVVAIEPATGAVLALYSNPSYDPSPIASNTAAVRQKAWDALNADPAKPLLQRAIREVYPPGSTQKIVTASSALVNGLVTLDTTFPTERSFTPPQTNRPLSNDSNEACGGTLVEAFAHSCNTVFARLAVQLGGQRLSDSAAAFGYNERPPLDIGPPVASFFPSAESFATNIPGLAFAGIGQGEVRATPLEVAEFSAAVANGGSIAVPRVLSQTRDPKGNVIATAGTDEWRRALPPETAVQMRTMMEQVVDSGTGVRVQIPGVTVAGKTGTAQDGNNTDAWFTGFAPSEQPQVAVGVIVENGGYGGRVAGPIAKAVIQAALAR